MSCLSLYVFKCPALAKLFSPSRCSASVCGAVKVNVIRKRGTGMCILFFVFFISVFYFIFFHLFLLVGG